MKNVFFSLIILLGGCASSGVIVLPDDKFVISKNTAKVGGGISASALAEVEKEAEDFCAKQAKEVERVDLKLVPGRAGSLGNVTLQFRCD